MHMSVDCEVDFNINSSSLKQLNESTLELKYIHIKIKSELAGDWRQ